VAVAVLVIGERQIQLQQQAQVVQQVVQQVHLVLLVALAEQAE
jgi:hypothetical protein